MPPDDILPADQSDELVAVIRCPKGLCRAEFEGIWITADEPGEAPARSLQLCPECGHAWYESWPGWSFTAEA
jgi:hypothetical protein